MKLVNKLREVKCMMSRIPDEFIEVLKEIKMEVPPRNVVDWLEWASRNPEDAKRLAEAYRGLGRSGRHEFAVALLRGESPDRAIESAVEDDAECRKKRSLLSKVIADAKKGGYRFTTPNGVECIVVRDRSDEGYWFNFKVEGEEIGILYGRRSLLCALELWGSGSAYKHRIKAVLYKDKLYSPYADIAKAIIRAVEENMKPEVLTAVDP